jgi:hypothetical protein
MLFRVTLAVCCENHTEHTDTLCGQNTEFWYVKAGGIVTTGPYKAKGRLYLFLFAFRVG